MTRLGEARFEDGPHPDVAIEEWVFAAWTADGALGLISGHRIIGRIAWYWAALARAGHPLFHVVDFEAPVRSDPFIVKGEGLWAEHHCVAALEQWSVGNEAHASALDDPDEALGRAYGDPTPMAFDLEWYASSPPSPLEPAGDRAGIEFGYEQRGVVHGLIELVTEPSIELVEIPAHRWHRWVERLAPMSGRPSARWCFPEARAHTGVRAPFAFPDGTTSDLVLSPRGWGHRTRR